MRCSLLTLSCYMDGELTERLRGEVEAHLIGCRRCATGMEHLREESQHIGALGRIAISDSSASDLLGQLGLPQPAAAAVGDQPDGGAAVAQRVAPQSPQPLLPGPAPSALPPWLTGTSGPALPWRADVAGRTAATRASAEGAAESTVELSGRASLRAPEVTETTRAAAGGPAGADGTQEAFE